MFWADYRAVILVLSAVCVRAFVSTPLAVAVTSAPPATDAATAEPDTEVPAPLVEPPAATAPTEEALPESNEMPPSPRPPQDVPRQRAASKRRESRPRPELPRYKGTGRLIAGGILSAGSFGLRIAMSLGTHPIKEPAEGTDDIGDYLPLVVAGFVTTPVLAGGLGLIGSGLTARGRWTAVRDARDRAEPRFDYRFRERLGWGLLGAGAGLWLVTRVSLAACNTDRCAGAVLDGGFYPSVGLIAAGVALAPFSRGYRKAERALRVEGLSVQPVVSPSHAGLSVSARF